MPPFRRRRLPRPPPRTPPPLPPSSPFSSPLTSLSPTPPPATPILPPITVPPVNVSPNSNSFPAHSHLDPFTPQPMHDDVSPSTPPTITEQTLHAALEQLVNDSNQVGPGHDFLLRPHVCTHTDCDKAFARKSDLARHYRIHTNDRPFVCHMPDCNKAFIQRSALTVHTRTHTGEKPHLCETCKKAFADSSSLARHRRIHTGNRPYGCKVPNCGRAFARRNTFLKHHKSHHPDVPTPSTNSKRHPVHFPVGRSHSATFLAPGPPGPDGNPQYYVHTPSSDSTPHGFAAPRPSEGAAYAFTNGGFNGPSGGVSSQGHGHGSSHGHFIFTGGGGSGARLGFGSTGPGGQSGRQPVFHQPRLAAPAAPAPQRSEQTNVSNLHSPISAATSSTFSHHSHPSTYSTVHSPTTSVIGDGHAKTETGDNIAHSSTIRGDQVGAMGFGRAQHIIPHQNATYPVTRPQDMMWFKTDSRAVHPHSRRVSHPQPHHSARYGGMGGAFVPSQLAMPAQHHTHLAPSYHQSFPATNGPSYEPISSSSQPHPSPNERNGDVTRESSPPLVDVNTVPDFSFHPPSGPPMSVPYSAIDGPHFNPLSNDPPQIALAPSLPVRLHSAPPFIQRFSSLPNTPSMFSHSPAPLHNTGDFALVQGSLTDGSRSSSGDIEDWADLEEQMLTRDVSTDPEDEDDSQMMVEVTDGEVAKAEKVASEWGAPISFPQHPRLVVKNPFSSSASSTSTSSTLVAPAMPNSIPHPTGTLPLVPVFPQQVNPQGLHPSPDTPWSAVSNDQFEYQDYAPVFGSEMLGSPAQLSQRGYHGALQLSAASDSSESSMHPDIQNITLITPPRAERRDTTTSVGLDISNVHFEDLTNDIAVEDPYTVKEEMEPASEDDLSDPYEDDGADNDSDDDFVLGGRKKKLIKKKGGGEFRARKKGEKSLSHIVRRKC